MEAKDGKDAFPGELARSLAFVGAESGAAYGLWLFLRLFAGGRSYDNLVIPGLAAFIAVLVGEIKTSSASYRVIRPFMVGLNVLAGVKLTTGNLPALEAAAFVGGMILLNGVAITLAHALAQKKIPPEGPGKPPQLPPGANP